MQFIAKDFESFSNRFGLFLTALSFLFVTVTFMYHKESKKSIYPSKTSVMIEYSINESYQETIETLNITEAIVQEHIKEETSENALKEVKAVKKAETAASKPKQIEKASLEDLESSYLMENLSENDEFMSSFIKIVQNNLYYPFNARKAGITGVVKIKVVFNPDGNIKNISLVEGSYHKTLGSAAIKTMEKVKESWKPLLSPGSEQTIVIPVSFELT